MRARRTDRLSKKDRRGIVSWLEGGVWCPFRHHGIVGSNKRCFRCGDIFPALDHEEDCPCEKYSRRYVTRVARKILSTT